MSATSATSTAALLSLQQGLRRSFQTLRSGHAAWRSALADCGPLMSSVGNVGAQWRALSALRLSATPLAAFPQLEERLRFKLQLAADAALRGMDDKMLSLQAVRDSVSEQLSCVLQQWEELSPRLEACGISARSPTQPSPADMLEWLQDAERHYRRQFLRMKCLLRTMRADEPPPETAGERWVALLSPAQEQSIQDSLCRVSFFLESG